MLSLSEKSVIFLPHRAGFNGREFGIEPILVELAKDLFQISKCLPPHFLLRLSGIFFPYPRTARFCSVSATHLSTKSNTRLIELWCSFGCASSVQDIQNVMVDDALSEPWRNLSSSNR